MDTLTLIPDEQVKQIEELREDFAYFLVTYDRNGFDLPSEEWQLVRYSNGHFIDNEGVYWDEWLTMWDLETIYSAKVV